MAKDYHLSGLLVSWKKVNLTILLSGLVLFLIPDFLISTWDLPFYWRTTLSVSSKVGEAFIVLAVISYALGRFQAIELKKNVSEVVGDVLETVREDVTSDAYVDYSWDCYVEKPPPSDPHPEYLFQSMRIRYSIPNLPDQFKLGCVSCDDEDAASLILQKMGSSDDFLFRFKVDPCLDPRDDNVFIASELFVGGVRLALENVENFEESRLFGVEASGSRPIRAKIYTFRRASAGVPGREAISFSVTVRKLAYDRTQVGPVFFRNAVCPRARVQADPALELVKIRPETLSVSHIGVARPIESGFTFGTDKKQVSAFVYINHIVKARSSIEFFLHFR